MQALLRQRLTKVALALVVAGYCSIPAMAADGNLKSGQWQIVTKTTGTIQGTVPWITRSATEIAETDKAHVSVTIDRGSRTVTSDGDKQFHVGDKVTVNWAIGDEQGDLDTNNTATKGTVQWMSYSDQSGSDGQEIGTAGSDTYEVQASDAGRYIGIKITPTTTTGDPNIATELLLNDLSTNTGGGSDSDDVPEGPVVDENVHVVIYESTSNTNLLGTTTNLKTNATYKVLLWKDKAGGTADRYDAGEEVTDKYDYRWKFTGTSKIAGTGAAGIVNESWNNRDLVIPITNAEAKTEFEGASGGVTIGTDGVQGFGLSIDYRLK
ncbi:SinI family autotransporter-associated protein [Citrobacter sp. Res13-Sevr-PEB04-36]|uniref:SinI family autotransporter-associated protein n=1 Tax=Citrobacter sp. Res13-Sevr-PEB04-36 TaxID=2777960 RepID=UPI0018ACABA4|nr:SinI family autotransporter-associated protein [Citrobacter sp. Res13-Sevr-PEB04-36]